MFPTKKEPRNLEWDEPVWFIIIEHRQEGPYSLSELKSDRRFTPDTLVWKKGFLEWTPARFVPEIQEIFKDKPEAKPLHGTPNDLKTKLGKDHLATLTLQQDPYPILLWVLIILTILFYTLYQLYYR